MRCYPKDSAQAAGRIVGLTLLADGHLSRTELNLLERDEVAQRLGLDALALQDLLRQLAHDLVATGASPWDSRGQLDETVIASLVAELADPQLRRQVLALCEAVACADGHLSDGEDAVLAQAAHRWGLPRSCNDC